MALEQFFERYPAGENLHKIVTVEQLANADTQTPAVFLTKRLIQNASSALREKDRQIVNERKLPSTPESGMIVFREAQEEVAAIRYGCLALGLTEAVDDGFFDHERFATRSNLGISGTCLPNFGVPPFVTYLHEALTPEQIQKLNDVRKNDPSFFTLLASPKLFPAELRKTLESERFLDFDFVHNLAKEMKLRMESFMPYPPRARKPEPQSVIPYASQEQPATQLDVIVNSQINEILENLNF